jgi:hypothetical protein
MAWKRLSLLLLVGLASGLIAAGCGGDDDDDGGDSASVPTDITLPTVTDAESVEEAQEQATEAVEDAKSQAYEACLDALDNVPDDQRDAAEQACESLK